MTLADSESQVSEAKHTEICRTNYPLSEANGDNEPYHNPLHSRLKLFLNAEGFYLSRTLFCSS
jgi:hypothetical protein